MRSIAENAGDNSFANISSLTANMSIDESSESDQNEYQHELEDEYEIDTTDIPPIPSHRSSFGSEIGRVSPIFEKKVEAPVDPCIEAFLRFASEYVAAEILNSEPKFAVILASHSHKHVFSRKWVAKKELTSVVEKPERLKSACIGIGMAQKEVALKLLKSVDRRTLYCPHFEAVHGKDWATELYALCSKASAALSRRDLEVPESWPYYDIYLAPATIDALEGNISALEMGIDEIFTGDVRRAFVVVRPPGHHCHEDTASGFCIINNAHIAIQYAKSHYAITHAVILDFDLHHGDGSQDLLWKLGFKSEGYAELPMGYFSIHDINSFPCEAGFAQPEQIRDASVSFVAHNCAVWNVHLKPYQTEAEFNEIYATEYSMLFTKASEFLEKCRVDTKRKNMPFKPLIVLSAGFDGSEFENQRMQRHNVNVPTSFYNRFTRDSVALAENYGTGHLISLLEGGYSPSAVSTGVFSHLTGLAHVAYEDTWCPPRTTPHEIDWGMRQRWRMHPEKWTATGVKLGRALFPIFDQAHVSPSSAPTSNVDDETRPRLRSKTWSL